MASQTHQSFPITVELPALQKQAISYRVWVSTAIVATIILKLGLMAVFSSTVDKTLFQPFITHYLQYGGNPWETFPAQAGDSPFPYHPLMLYIVAACSAPFFYFASALPSWLVQIGFKLPILLADSTILLLLMRMFPKRALTVVLLYGLSLILLYSSYLHGQLDVIPMAFMFASVYLLRKSRWLWSAVLLGLGLTTKLQLLAALPLILVYLWKTRRWGQAILYLAVVTSVYLIITGPYLASPGFVHLVLLNNKQLQLFRNLLYIGTVPLFLNVFAIFIVYARFTAYRKVNFDLLESFLLIVFALFVLLTPPSPGWYIWLLPSMMVFTLQSLNRRTQGTFETVCPYLLLNVTYFVYFAFCDPRPLLDVLLLNHPLFYKVTQPVIQGLAFTLLEATVFGCLVLSYRAGVKSNRIYKLKRSLVMGIGGDSSAGKTTLLTDIQTMLGNKVLTIEGDGDHKWERDDPNWQEFTHLNPKANHLHRQADHIVALREGRPVNRSDYNHITGKFTETERLQPREFILLSGLHPFYLPRMRKVIDLKIYLDPHPVLKQHWKIQRDTTRRGYTATEVITQIEQRRPDVEKYIAPQRHFADLVIQLFPLDENVLPATMDFEGSDLGLSVTMDSSLPLENLVTNLDEAGYPTQWDYTDDLETQTLTLHRPVATSDLAHWVSELVPNLDEITGETPCWQPGYRGFIQLIAIMLLSENLQTVTR